MNDRIPRQQHLGTDVSSAEQKVLDTVTAGLALTGRTVYRLPSGGFIVCDPCSSRHCPDLKTLVLLARHVAAVGAGESHDGT